jgi:hypothetical protein
LGAASMSEYQYYEFLALDRPLTAAEQGDPAQLIRDYYDAHLYLANWGTHRIMLRLPRTVLDVDAVRAYCVEDLVTITDTGEHVIIDLLSEDEPDRLLLQAAQGQGTRVTLELLQRFRQTPAVDDGGSAP